MKVASVEEVGSSFAAYLKASKKGPVVVTQQGKPIAVLLRTTNQDDLERLLMGHSPQLQAILEAARQRFRAGAGIPHDRFWQEVEAASARQGKKQPAARKSGRGNGKA